MGDVSGRTLQALDPERDASQVRTFSCKSGAKRARRFGAAIIDLTLDQWQTILHAHDFRCAYCHRRPKCLTMDHLVPLSKGGNHTATNVVPACPSCNTRKGNVYWNQFVQSADFALDLPRDAPDHAKGDDHECHHAR